MRTFLRVKKKSNIDKSKRPEENIMVFKTNMNRSIDFIYVKPLLTKHSSIINWSVDLEDIDCVLRIEAINSFTEQDVISLFKDYHIYCEVLL